MKATNYKRWGWDRSSNVRLLFEGDLARPGHPPHMETLNKQGECVPKLRCHICRTLISYHNSSWTCVATHIQSHSITTAQDIVALDALASASEVNVKPCPIHKLPIAGSFLEYLHLGNDIRQRLSPVVITQTATTFGIVRSHTNATATQQDCERGCSECTPHTVYHTKILHYRNPLTTPVDRSGKKSTVHSYISDTHFF